MHSPNQGIRRQPSPLREGDTLDYTDQREEPRMAYSSPGASSRPYFLSSVSEVITDRSTAVNLPPFRRRQRLPSILLDSWAFRKIASEGSVLPNALAAWDVDGDGKEEVILGTTEGHVLVVKPDCRVPIFTRVLAATISTVLYSETHRRLVLITLEGQCEVLDNFLVPVTPPQKAVINTAALHATTACSKTNSAPPASRLPCSTPQNSSTATVLSPAGAAAPIRSHNVSTSAHVEPTIANIFHIPSNCICAAFAVDGPSDRVFLGSYDRRLYIYMLSTGECLASVFMHHPITCVKPCLVPVPPAPQSQSRLHRETQSPLGRHRCSNASHRPSDSPLKTDWAATFPPAAAAAASSSTSTLAGAVPLVFVATPHSIALLPGGVADAHAWCRMETREKNPLSIVDPDAISRHCTSQVGSPSHPTVAAAAVASPVSAGSAAASMDWATNSSHCGDFHGQNDSEQETSESSATNPYEDPIREVAQDGEAHAATTLMGVASPLTLIHPLWWLNLKGHSLEVLPVGTPQPHNAVGSSLKRVNNLLDSNNERSFVGGAAIAPLSFEDPEATSRGSSSAGSTTSNPLRASLTLKSPLQPSEGEVEGERLLATSLTKMQAESDPQLMHREGSIRPTLVSLANVVQQRHEQTCSPTGEKLRCRHPQPDLPTQLESTVAGAVALPHAAGSQTAYEEDVRLPIAMDVTVTPLHVMLAVGCEDGRAFVLRGVLCRTEPAERNAGRTSPRPTHRKKPVALVVDRQGSRTTLTRSCRLGEQPPNKRTTLFTFREIDRVSTKKRRARDSVLTVPIPDVSGETPVIHKKLHRQPQRAAGCTKALSEVVVREEDAFAIRMSCAWGGVLTDSPLVRQSRIFRVGADSFRAVFVAVNGACYVVDPDTHWSVECTVRADSSAFTILAGSASCLVPPFGGLGADGRDSPAGGSDASQLNAPGPVPSCVGDRAISCVCVSVDELCIYTIGESFWGAGRPGTTCSRPHSTIHGNSDLPLSNSRTDTPTTVLRQPSGEYVLPELEREAGGDAEERALLLELGTTLLYLQPDSATREAGLADESFIICYAKRVLNHGYNAKDWETLRWMDRREYSEAEGGAPL